MSKEILSCEEFRIVRPEQTVAEGCPVLTKVRHVISNKGVQAVVEWPLLNGAGDAVDLSSLFPTSGEDSLSVPACEAGSVVARFVNCDETGQVLEADAEVYDAGDGLIRFELPATVADFAGIYRMEIGVADSAGRVVFSDRGLLSVERGLFGDLDDLGKGPPTLNEIRMALRDSLGENNLLRNVEFSGDEIVFSVVRPVAEWNETPPPVTHYNCNTFPWREMWLRGIIGLLLQTAGHHYVRNKLPARHGGLEVNDKAKDNEYFALANQYRQEWRSWMFSKKVSLNAQLGFGGIGSVYD